MLWKRLLLQYYVWTKQNFKAVQLSKEILVEDFTAFNTALDALVAAFLAQEQKELEAKAQAKAQIDAATAKIVAVMAQVNPPAPA